MLLNFSVTALDPIIARCASIQYAWRKQGAWGWQKLMTQRS
jgi:hypothetical protein